MHAISYPKLKQRANKDMVIWLGGVHTSMSRVRSGVEFLGENEFHYSSFFVSTLSPLPIPSRTSFSPCCGVVFFLGLLVLGVGKEKKDGGKNLSGVSTFFFWWRVEGGGGGRRHKKRRPPKA